MRIRKYNTIPVGFIPTGVVERKIFETVDSSEMSRLLKLVYASDPRTGLPCGELQVLASDSVPPEIAAWVRNQLLNPIQDNSVSSIIQGSQLDDETILALTRNVDESDRAYIDRVDSYLREWNKEKKEDN